MNNNGEAFAIRTKGLTKSYGSVQALKGVDLEVKRGEIFGFLGPNGAGKTTAIRCLLDLIRPDGGSIRVLGVDPQVDPVSVQARAGYLPGELKLDDKMTADKQLHFLDDLRGKRADWDYVRQLAKQLDLDLKRQIKNLSKGNKQKVGVIQALMHRPELLLLDEPTSGLDPLMQKIVQGLIRQAKSQGATVFFSSHIMSEVEAVADRVGIIRHGEIVEVAETSTLTHRTVHKATVRFDKSVDSTALATVPGIEVLSTNNGTEMTLRIEGKMDSLIKALSAYPVNDLETSQPSLEEIFLTYYEI